MYTASSFAAFTGKFRLPRYRFWTLISSWIFVIPLGFSLIPLGFCMMPSASSAPALLGTTCINQQGMIIASIPLQGGKFVCQSVVKITQANQYVIDFKNTSIIDRFQHEITAEQASDQGKDSHDKNDQNAAHSHLRLIFKGGLSSSEHNPILLRHGRIIPLEPGTYRLITWLQSPYLLAPPALFITDLASYQKQANISAAATLLLMGTLFGLFSYYVTIGMLPGHVTERLYATFIFGNLVFYASSSGAFNQFFDWHWFYLTGAPLLIANLAYVYFICQLLGINQYHRPRLHLFSTIASSFLIAMLVLGLIFPNWMLEMARYGILVFLGFGLVCGIRLSVQRQMIGQLYLLAIIGFGLLCIMAINATDTPQQTFTLEQLGLFAITTHTTLLSLLVAYKISRLHHEKEQMLVELQNTRSLAMTDRLTGIPNRHALENKLLKMPAHGCLMFLDMDNLKHLNDQFGHETGDQLLKLFCQILTANLSNDGQLYRQGGDEFAILCHEDDVEWCQHQLEYTHLQLQKEGFAGIGASVGIVFAHEASSTEGLLRIADKRMYINKRSRKNRKEMIQVLRP